MHDFAPETIAVNRMFARIYTYLRDDPQQAEPREYEISLPLIESVETLSVLAAQEGTT